MTKASGGKGTPATAAAAVPDKATTARPRKPAAPKRPAHLPYGRWLGDFEPLSEAERTLVANSARGVRTYLSKDRPEEASDTTRIRAEVLRFLALGGDTHNPVHEGGINLMGAWVHGWFDLEACKVVFPLTLLRCHMADTIILLDAHLDQLNLGGSRIQMLHADRLTVEGGIFLRNGFETNGEVRLSGASVGGDLDCSGGRFDNPSGRALSVDRVETKGSIFLGEDFHAYGQVRLLGAEIGGNLDCSGGQFDHPDDCALSGDGLTIKGDIVFGKDFHANGEVRLFGAQVGGGLFCSGGRFDHPDGYALIGDGLAIKGDFVLGENFHANGEVRLLGATIDGDLNCSRGYFSKGLGADRATVNGALFMRRATISGKVSLAGCHVHTLIDDAGCWPDANLILDGFRYDSIGDGPTSARQRTDWLKKQRPRYLNEEFCPQPWEQLIRVLREMGHGWDANEVAIEKQHMLRRAGKIGTREPRTQFWFNWRCLLPIRQAVDHGWNWFSNRIARLFHIGYGLFAGYGYRPTRILYWMMLVCSLSSLAYYEGRQHGLIGPTSAVIQSEPAYRICGDGGEVGKQYWTQCSAMPSAYTTFQPFFYSLDLILPLIDLQQDPDWAPIVASQTGETLWAGRMIRWLTWFEILFGWVMSLMFVAIVGRLVEKD